MDFKQKMQNYAKVLIHRGLALQPGQSLQLFIPVECAELARELAREAYRAGAKDFQVSWTDDGFAEIQNLQGDDVTFDTLAQEYERMNGLFERDFAFLRVYAPYFSPEGAAQSGLMRQQLRDNLANTLRGQMFRTGASQCIASGATENWAAKLFPGRAAQEAVALLWEDIFKVTRADQDDPLAAWQTHSAKTVQRGVVMTQMQYDSLHYVGGGTDLHVGLPNNHIWGGGEFPTKSGAMSTPNIPTEELACTPDKYRVDGTVKSTKPLAYQGGVVEDFEITFENGRAVSWTAGMGGEILDRILGHDAGSCYLGEVALVAHNSLISNTGKIFYCTLLDENASCHLALGRGFPSFLKDAAGKSPEELDNMGVNQSAIHVDFMIGGPDINVFGEWESGNSEPVFINGEWAF